MNNIAAGSKVECVDSPEELDRKVLELAEWIMESQQLLCYTGAGISANCGSPSMPTSAHMALV